MAYWLAGRCSLSHQARQCEDEFWKFSSSPEAEPDSFPWDDQISISTVKFPRPRLISRSGSAIKAWSDSCKMILSDSLAPRIGAFMHTARCQMLVPLMPCL